MRYCTRCVLPDTKPGVVFDAEGVCSACRSVERKKTIDWDGRAKKLAAMCDEIRGSNGVGYDCIVPVSGGKDSMYQVYMMTQVYKLKTLAVIVSPHVQTPEGIHNLNSLVENLGVDLIKISVRPSTLQKMRRVAMLKLGNPNYAEHRVVFAAVARAALFYNAPLVVWGEDIAVEFGGSVEETSATDGSAEDLASNDLFRESSFEDLVSGVIPDKELFFYMHPAKEEFKRRNFKSIYLGFFHFWDGYKHYQISKDYGFVGRKAGVLSGNIINYDNIDEKLCEIHQWFKFLKLGFGRATDQACYQIWNGRMTREEAVRQVREVQYDFPKEYFQEFLEYHQVSEAEFWQSCDHWRNHDIWQMVGNEWRLKVEVS
jgi:N-acetyl sugar amidotransferase